MKKSTKTWTSTRYKSLYRHKSGVYHARLTVNGKRTWRSLKTEVQSIALEELRTLKKQIQVQEEMGGAEDERNDGPLTFEQAAAIWLERIEIDPSRKAGTKRYWRDTHKAMKRHSPKLFGKQVKKVSRADCEAWAQSYSQNASPSRYNNAVSAMKNILEVGVERGERTTNPAQNLKRVKPVEKDITSKLPDKVIFAKWVAEIRKSPSRWADGCGDLVEFLAYSGLRIGETKHVLWKHVDLEKGEILVVGDPEEGAKNRSVRRVPIISGMEQLLLRLRTRPIQTAPEERVLPVSTAAKAMNRAAKAIGMEPITHHDLRHLFATVCIESGVDVPTVAEWLGHKDGGALAMRVYGHLRDEHSQSAAKKVSFG